MVLRCRWMLCLLSTLTFLLTACTLQSMHMAHLVQHPPAPRPPSPAFRDNRVQVGLTMTQVRALLPAPDTVDTVADGTWWGYYFSDDEMYFIRFTYGRVVLVVKATRAELLPIYGRSAAVPR